MGPCTPDSVWSAFWQMGDDPQKKQYWQLERLWPML
jgi:hypothetical protein